MQGFFFLLGDKDDGDYVGVGAVVHTLFFTWRPLARPFFLLGDNDDGDYVGVGAVVHTLFFYLEAPCKASFFTWRPLVRPFFLLGGPL